MTKDNPLLKKTTFRKKCPNGYYKIALAIKANQKDYHYYRQDSNQLWSHKNGANKATNKDHSGQIITNPKTADRGKYTKFCGYYIVPIESKYKHATAQTRRYKNKISKYDKLAQFSF